MLRYLHTYLNGVLRSHEVGERESRESEKKLVYRDELNKKSSKKKVRFCGESGERKIYTEGKEGRIRVKVTMTKRDAERLLAKCKDGGVLEFRDVVRELVQIPASQVTIVSPVEDGLQLQSIPEE